FTSACPIGLEESQGEDTNDVTGASVRNIGDSTTTRVSVAEDGAEADGASTIRGLSDDGRYVLFSSDATNLVENDDNESTDLFVLDRSNGALRRIGVTVEYGQIPEGIVGGTLSRNGQFVVFWTAAALLPTDDN